MRILAIIFFFFLTGCASTQVTDSELMAMGSAHYKSDYIVTRIPSHGAVADVLAISLGEVKGRSSRAEPLLRDLVLAKKNGVSNVVVGGNNPSLTSRVLRDAFAIAKPGVLEGLSVMVTVGEEYRDMIAPGAAQAGVKLVLAPVGG